MSSSSSREILHLSLGREACELTAHWVNLQGLAATATDNNGEEDDDALCDAHLSHTTMSCSNSNDSQLLIPRVLMVDYHAPPPQQQQQHWNRRKVVDDTGQLLPDDVVHGVWSGAVQPLNRSALKEDHYSHDDHHAPHPEDECYSSSSDVFMLDDFLRTANVLAEGSLSRYRVEKQAQVSSSHNSNKRHVDWDDLLEEEEESEDETQRQAQKIQQQRQWHQSKHQLQTSLDTFWTSVLLPTATESTTSRVDSILLPPPPSASPSSRRKHPMAVVSSWRNYFMPPYHPKSIFSVSSSAAMDEEDSYLSGKSACGDVYDAVEERLRWLLEDCSACQGVVLTTTTSASGSNSGSFFSGLSTPVLEYLSDECPSARRWVVSLQQQRQQQQQQQQSQDTTNTRTRTGEVGMEADETPLTSSSSSTWRTHRIQSVRRSVESGLMWQDHVSLSHAVLPLILSRPPPPSSSPLSSSSASFANTAWTAAALETATLSYRLRGSSNNSSSSRAPAAKIGLNSYYYGDYSGGGDGAYGTAAKLSLAEFLTTLTPSPKHTVLELDALLPASLSSPHLASCSSSSSLGEAPEETNMPFWQRLQEGTSVERDSRMKYQQSLSSTRSPRVVLPGAWLLPRPKGGILSPLSPFLSPQQEEEDRSRHQHFSLISSLRGPMFTASASSGHYITCLLEGMGIRFRPEQSMACVCEQSFGKLVEGGYAAGSYWNALSQMRRRTNKNGVFVDNVSPSSSSLAAPILAVMGNTTRSHGHLAAVAKDMRDVLSSPRFRQSYSRDVASGILPETEDCEEALSFCLDLRDVYRPPHDGGDDDMDGESF